MKLKLIFATFLSIIIFSQSTPAQVLRLGVDAGASKLVGQEYERWDWGYTIGANLFLHLNPNVMLGARVGYNRWKPDNEELLNDIENILEGDVEGEGSVIELLPLLRLSTAEPMSAINLFIQGGAGLYIVKTETTISGIVGESPFENVIGEDSKNHFGFQVGAGLNLGDPMYLTLDLFPVFNYVFIDDADLKYLTFNVGLSFGI